MKAHLPKLFEKYVQASNENDLKEFVFCFSDSTTVQDEGETRSGIGEISSWFSRTRAKYKFKTEPLRFDESGDGAMMTAKVAGDFPGSPIILTYHFRVKSGLIQDLRISQ